MTANLFKEEIGKLFPALGQLSAVSITDEMWRRVGKKDGEYALAIYETLMAKMIGIANATVIRIPSNVTAESVLVEAKKSIPFTSFYEAVLESVTHDLELIRGRTLQVFMHKFAGRWYPEAEGLGLQRTLGFDGNAAAYLIWLTHTKHMGQSISIPANGGMRFQASPGMSMQMAPYYLRDNDFCGLYGVSFNDVRSRNCILVSFRLSPFE